MEKTVAPNTEDPENVGPALIVTVKDRLTKQLEGGEKESKHAVHLLTSLHHIIIFDCTIAEARDAAAGGCSLYEYITRRHMRLESRRHRDVWTFPFAFSMSKTSKSS